MIKTLKSLQQLRELPFDIFKDKPRIMELYDTVCQIANNKNDFVRQSSGIMEALGSGKLSDREEKNWLNYASEIYASYAAVKIYESSQQGTLRLSAEELEQVLSFYLHGKFSKEITAMGIYVCARQMAETDPMQAYELTKKAFTIYPDLANFLGVQYRYKGKAAEEELTEECPWCGSKGEDIIPYYCSPQVMDLNHKQSFPPAKLWMKCRRCGNYFVYNFPKSSVGLINGHYTRERNDDQLQYTFPLATYDPIFNQFRAFTLGTDYLEIGTGTGEMLAVALEFGYHVEAIEICQADCERISSALGVDVKWCDIADYETDKQYDVIVMGDVLEHVLEPVHVLKKVKQMLKKDGVLWISTPNYNCAYARMEKFSHTMWHQLRHYTYVSFESLKEVLQSIDLEVLHYNMSPRYIGSMELFIKHKDV